MERVSIANTNPKKAGAPILRKQTLKTKVLQGIRRLVYNETKFKSLQRNNKSGSVRFPKLLLEFLAEVRDSL